MVWPTQFTHKTSLFNQNNLTNLHNDYTLQNMPFCFKCTRKLQVTWIFIHSCYYVLEIMFPHQSGGHPILNLMNQR